MQRKINNLRKIIKKKNLEIMKLKNQINTLTQNNNVKKAALLIGINYYNTQYELGGCINDVEKIKDLLINKYDFKEENIYMICDKDSNSIHPTENNILEGFNWLINKNEQGFNKLWVHYSGHGSYSKDYNNDEEDGKDECICTSDDKFIDDDIINKKLIQKINENTTLICFMDCCHSGTILDLKYKYISGNKNEIQNNIKNTLANVILISGCKDYQTSDDAYYDGEWSGAMTKFFLETIENDNYNITCYNLLRKMRNSLKKNNHTQIPQMTCSRKLNAVTIFTSTNNNDDSYI